MEIGHSKDLGLEWTIIVKDDVSKKWGGKVVLEWFGSEQGQAADTYEYHNVLSVAIKCGEFVY